MKKVLRLSMLLLGAIAFSISAKAQTDVGDLLKFINQAKGDVEKISYAYMEPLAKSVSKGFNGGWYTSAKTHKLGGFDLTIGANAVMVSSSMKTFDVSKLGLTNLAVESGSKSVTPTVLGKAEDGAVVYLNGDKNQKMTLPQGANIPTVPVPTINIGIGLPFKTDLSVRFFPTVKFGDGQSNLWGFALKNEFKEFIPVFKALPFSVSAFYGFTKYNVSWSMTDNEYADQKTKNQKLSLDSYSYTARLLVSKSIPFLTVYGGLGYNGASTDFVLKGNYIVEGVNLNNPISNEFTANGFILNAGLRLKFGVFMLFGDYTYADYSMLSAGLGVTFR